MTDPFFASLNPEPRILRADLEDTIAAIATPLGSGGLGVVRVSHEKSFVIADIPGLIEGASEGAGLGTRFLGHVERTAVLIHLVDGTQEDVAAAWRTVREELKAYGEDLADKPEILALNKIDALDAETRKARAAELKAVSGKAPMLVSGVSGEGVSAVLRAALAQVRAARAAAANAAIGTPQEPEDWKP